jgi:ABC-type bacteriocin/lantibiotic exporter with double-glycine peptidase domain
MAHRFYPTIILPVKRKIQERLYDCGPSSLIIILETLGRTVSEKTLMRLARTNPETGTDTKDLSRTLQKLNVYHQVHYLADRDLIESSIRNLNLCIVNYQAWGKGGRDAKTLSAGHYSVIFGFNVTHFYLADPSKVQTKKRSTWGFRQIRKDLFEERWQGKDTKRWLLTVPLAQGTIV